MSVIESLQIDCKYDPEREGSIDDLIAYKNALEDRLGYVEHRLITLVRESARAVEEDNEKWGDLAIGQDTEEAEWSGYIEGELDTYQRALALLRGEVE